MIPLVQSELAPLTFEAKTVAEKQRIKAQSNKIGWIHSIGNPGTRFDIRIKDALGRVKFEKMNCGNDTDKYGEMINFPTQIGEELDVEIENIQGTEKVDIFIN